MSLEEKIRIAVNDCRERLELIKAASEIEILKPFGEQQRDLLTFLYKEKEVYSYALDQLESLLKTDLCEEKSFE
jgi:hypothetical protein